MHAPCASEHSPVGVVSGWVSQQVDRRDGQGGLTHSYYDYIADAPHDGYYTAAGIIEHLSGKDAPPCPSKVTIACDNGMVSGMFVYSLSKLAITLKMAVRLVPLAAYHAFSLCDSHGGHFKPAMKRAACGGIELRLDQVKQNIEAACQRTHVHVITIDREELDQEWFGGAAARTARHKHTCAHTHAHARTHTPTRARAFTHTHTNTRGRPRAHR
jgi:hypothetical protein